MEPILANPGPIPVLDAVAWWGALATIGVTLLLGGALLPRLKGWRRADAWFVRAAAGMGPAALAALLAGQWSGLLARIPWGWMGAAGWLACLASLFRERLRADAHRLGAAVESESSAIVFRFERILALAGWGAIALWLLVMLGPAFCPSISYDVLEYHLAIVARALETGRIAPIPHVFYTAQPVATEMLMTLAASIEGTARGFAPGALLWFWIVLATLLFARLAAALNLPRGWRPWLWLLLLTHPIPFGLQLDRLSDWTGLLLLLAGLWAAARMGGVATTRPQATPTAVLLGLLAAGAVGAKWTNLGTVALPLGLLAAGMAWRTARASGRAREGLMLAGGWGTAFVLLLAPWMAWLWGAAGNPVAPFLASVFPTPAWPPARLEFLLWTHGAVSPFDGVYWANLARRLTTGFPGLPLIALGLAAGAVEWAVTRRESAANGIEEKVVALPTGLLTLGLAGGTLLWGQLLHAADRFLAPLCALGWILLALSLKRIAHRWGRPAIGGAMALAAVALFIPQMRLLGQAGFAHHALGRIDRAGYLEERLGLTAAMFEAANRLPAGARLLAINEARGFHFQRRIDLASVFDEQPIRPFLKTARDAADLASRLRAAGYTHLLVNEFEEARLLTFHPPKALAEDAAFARLRAAYGAEDPAGHLQVEQALVEQYPGYAAFAAVPLDKREREVYLSFQELLRERAIWPAGLLPGFRPAIWIAPL